MNNKLYILCGLPFSGKTTLAKEIESKLNAVRVNSGEIKTSLFGKDIIDHRGWEKVYTQVYTDIKTALEQGKTVIYDNGNFAKYERGLAKNIADKLEVETTTIFISIPKEVAQQRAKENNLADLDFQDILLELELPDASEKHLVFSHDEDINKWIQKNFK